MAEPSLGYAIGLNVKRQDIFAPAAKQLSQNLATWKADKAQAKKEKEAKASKVMDDMMKMDPSTFNRKIRNEATAGFEKSKKELESAIDAGKSERELLEIVYQTKKNLASYKDQSDNRDLLDKYVLANPGKAPTVLTNYSANNRSRLSEDEIALLQGFGVGYDRETNILTSFGYEPVDVRASLNQAKPTEDELLATTSKDDIQKNISIIKTKAGYDPIAFARLKPTEQWYALSLANVMYNEPGAVGSISEEVLRKDYGGSYDRYLVATRSKLDEMMKNTKEGDPLPTPFDAQRAIAIDYMVKNHAPEWTSSSTKVQQLNEPPKGGSSGKTEEPPDLGAVSEEFQFTTPAAYKTALDLGKKYGLSPEKILAVYGGEDDGSVTPEQKSNIIKSINKFGAAVAAPTISFQTQGAEKTRLGGESYNVNKMYYNKKDKSYYVIVDKQVSGEGTSMNLSKQVIKLTRSTMKDLVAGGATNSSIKNQLANWDRIAPSNGWPTTSQYSGVSAPSGSGGSGGGVDYGDM